MRRSDDDDHVVWLDAATLHESHSCSCLRSAERSHRARSAGVHLGCDPTTIAPPMGLAREPRFAPPPVSLTDLAASICLLFRLQSRCYANGGALRHAAGGRRAVLRGSIADANRIGRAQPARSIARAPVRAGIEVARRRPDRGRGRTEADVDREAVAGVIENMLMLAAAAHYQRRRFDIDAASVL